MMQAALFEKAFKLDLVNYPLNRMGEKDLRIRVETCGVCRTDLHIYSGEAPASPPVILGHEYVGAIVEIGSKVSGFQIDEKVAVDPNITCGYCSFCKKGKVNLCKNLVALGVNIDGGFAEYSVIPASQAYHLPEDFPAKRAAFAEPLSCCLRGIQQASIEMADSVAIVGGGTIGLLMLQLVRLSGAAKTILLEPITRKQEIAKQLSADFVLDSNQHDVVDKLRDITEGGADVVIECVGSSKAAELAVKIAKRGGRVVLFGLAERNATIELNLQDLFFRELAIKSSLLNPFTFQRAVDLLISNKIRVEPLEPVSVELENIPQLFSRSWNSSITKYQIFPSA